MPRNETRECLEIMMLLGKKKLQLQIDEALQSPLHPALEETLRLLLLQQQ